MADKDYQKELKDLYDTGTSDKDIAAAKQEQKYYEGLMKQGAAMMAPKEEKKETPMDAIRAIGEGATKKTYKKGGKILAAKGGKVRGHGIEQRGKTKGRFC